MHSGRTMQTQTTDSSRRAPLAEALHRDNGSPEVTARWLADHRKQVRLVDVREPHELAGPLGAIEGAENVPLQQVLTAGLPDDVPGQPVVLVCRSGRRSALAATALESGGRTPVASVEGGMLAWNADVLGAPSVYEDEKHANARNLADAIYTDNGVPEVSVQWVAGNIGRFRLVDVRMDEELTGPLGRIAQSEHVPLPELMSHAADWPADAPVVVHCKSGGRSARAANALLAAGFRQVASMEGGMLAWRAADLP